MSSMMITTARMTMALPAQDMDFVNGNARTSRTACVSLSITRAPTVWLGQRYLAKDKVKQAKFLVSDWSLLVRLGRHKDKVHRNAHAARQSTSPATQRQRTACLLDRKRPSHGHW